MKIHQLSAEEALDSLSRVRSPPAIFNKTTRFAGTCKICRDSQSVQALQPKFLFLPFFAFGR